VGTHPDSLPPRLTRVDPGELSRAWHVLRGAAERLDQIAVEEGWSVPFSPIRYLILAKLHDATTFGLSPRRLARLLAVRPSTLAHHLDVLERAEMICRSPRRMADMRKVAVRLTERGRYALARLSAATRTPASPSLRMPGAHPPPRR
jgi:DNA-binding MarR family transcriptional regulator